MFAKKSSLFRHGLLTAMLICQASCNTLFAYSKPGQESAVPTEQFQNRAISVELPDHSGSSDSRSGTEQASVKQTPEQRLRLRLQRFDVGISYSPQPLLGTVGPRRWMGHYLYSPDRAIDELATQPVGQMDAVGFPDIRTYQRQKRRRSRSAPVDPLIMLGVTRYIKRGRVNPLKVQSWERMIAWHRPEGRGSAYEPIAMVRCMGLSPKAVARRADEHREWIVSSAAKYKNVSPSLVKAVIAAESCFDKSALSPVGAQGLMQLMPDTATWLQVDNPHDPQQNIRGGTRYLSALLEQFDTIELVLAAYNAGPGNVRRYGGVPPFRETREYVKRVMKHYRRYSVMSALSSRW